MVLSIILIILCTGILFFLSVIIIDDNRFVVREYDIICDKLKREGTFVLLSDLHGKTYGKANQTLLKAIEAQKPDGILIAGDMITAAKRADISGTEALLQPLAEKYPIYYGNGNHEYRSRLEPEIYGDLYERYRTFLQRVHIEPLANSHVTLPPYQLNIYGLEIERHFYKKFVHHHMTTEYLEQELGRASADSCNVLIAHNPEFFPAYAAWGADIVVSGHLHGGIMRLPLLGGVISPRLQLFPKYDGGRFRQGKSTMILSRGLGTHTLPVRIFNPGELVVLHMKTH